MYAGRKRRDFTPQSPQLQAESPRFISPTPPPLRTNPNRSTPPHPHIFDGVASYPSPVSAQGPSPDFHQLNHPAFIPNDASGYDPADHSSSQIPLPPPTRSRKKKKKCATTIIDDPEAFEPPEPSGSEMERHKREVAELFSRDLIFGGNPSEIDPTFIKEDGAYRRQHNSWVIFEMGMLRTLDQFVKIHYDRGPIRRGDRLFHMLRSCCLQMIPEETLLSMSGVNFMSIKARYWDRRSDDERRIFADVAKEFTKLHKIRYPEYIYRPKQILAKKSKRSRRPQVNSRRARRYTPSDEEEYDEYLSPSPESYNVATHVRPVRITRSQTQTSANTSIASHVMTSSLDQNPDNASQVADDNTCSSGSGYVVPSRPLQTFDSPQRGFHMFSEPTFYADGYYEPVDQSAFQVGIPPDTICPTDMQMVSNFGDSMINLQDENGDRLDLTPSDWQILEDRMKSDQGQGVHWNINEILND